MPASSRVPWLVCYDIADPRRLHRVWRSVSKWATPFQYSVWKHSATRKDLAECLARMDDLIDSRYDDVRAYGLLTGGQHVVYGEGRLPKGVLVDDLVFNNREN